MKWVKALLGLVVIGGFVYGVYAVKNKKVEVPFLPVAEASVVVNDGLEVPLVLVTPLDSGGSPEGKEVRLVVAEDVKGPNGKIVIEQGAMATGKVVKSRAGTLVSVFTNEPARLEVELSDVVTADGSKVRLRGPAPDKPYSFDQSNTKIEESANVVDAVTDPKARELVASLARQIATGQQMSAEDKAQADSQLKDLAERYGFKDTTSFLQGQNGAKVEKKNDLAGVLESVQKGDIKGLAGTDVLLAAKAAGEIVNLGAGFDKSLRGIFKGSNIHARVGLPVKAFVAEEKSVTPKPVKP